MKGFPQVTQYCSSKPRDLNTDPSASRVDLLTPTLSKGFDNSVGGMGMEMRERKHHTWSEAGLENVS